MRFRVQAIRATTAMLYSGPLLGGLSGLGWGMVPLFTALFCVWLAILRPHQWPQCAAEWRSGEGILAAATHVLSQTLLVAICLGIGRGIGGVLDFHAGWTAWLPLVTSFAALPLLRLVWHPHEALASGQTYDELAAPADDGLSPAEAVARLMELGDGASPAEAAMLVALVLDGPGSVERLDRLAAVLAEAPPDRHAGLRRAVVEWATAPEIWFARGVSEAVRTAFAAAEGSDELLLRLSARIRILQQAAPWHEGAPFRPLPAGGVNRRPPADGITEGIPSRSALAPTA